MRRVRVALSIVLVVGAACSARPASPETGPGIVLPAPIAEGEGDGDEGRAGDAPTLPVEPDAGAPADEPPDPAPLASAAQWRYVVRYARGELSVPRVEAARFARPVVTARRMGRFAIELWVGAELIERVRFELPLLGAEEPPAGRRRPLHDPPSFGGGVDAEVEVLVPASARARRARLIDRATGKSVDLPWPPGAAATPPAASGARGAPSGSPAGSASPPPVAPVDAGPSD